MIHPDIVAVCAAYASYAPVYDAANNHPGYERWIYGLELLAREHGLHGRRLLDLGCGTGRSLEPLVGLGYEAVGVDAVPEMLAAARARLGAGCRLIAADLAELPRLGVFDLVVCLNDPLNYLSSVDRLRRAFQTISANLAPQGLLVFDTNNDATFHGVFAAQRELGDHERRIRWLGRGFSERSRRAHASIEVEAPGRPTVVLEHFQYGHSADRIRDALASADLAIAARYGQHDDGSRDDHVDPDVHTKTVWVVKHRSANPEGGER